MKKKMFKTAKTNFSFCEDYEQEFVSIVNYRQVKGGSFVYQIEYSNGGTCEVHESSLTDFCL